MSRITITLPNSLIDELLTVVDARSKTEAVIKAIKDEIRIKKKKKILEMAVKMEFNETADDIRHKDKRLG
ncbi:MAG: DUF2191 domain-containing protein [Thermodesulfovibrionia bacterium]|nr:DUF2191 domain-containing protein [Thermodesulfovibrionia bacterium]